jgi:small subunit ribosomal protein S21
MIRVQVRQNEPLEAALRRFKRQCNYAGIFRLAKKYAYHEKRSDKRRREERERVRAIQRAERKPESGGRGRKKRMRTSSVTLESARAKADSEESFEDTSIVGVGAVDE